ncbi:hypothetical protein GCM10028803_29660 [Larkinella knui]|uniref:Amino acid adenylation domain-containing protein n=1 Tax=Larkinella knui TaxID=2025310 RepID=A0A3P1CX53_9BACT|nr:non-ribosomal peptide synthetase [Larkinella knui]RRB17997.1 amino acid adenylation domain-containing protein [Larkinella knui]
MAYSCFIIGKDTLLIECATILRQNDFQLKGILSDDPAVRRYCEESGIRYLDSGRPLEPVLEPENFDFLFSITNDLILPESVLRLPRRGAINYHDGPLPAYAGVHATFWSLVNQEKTHGVTWHRIDAGIDTGAILKQRRFPIDSDETSIRINIKCYSAAVASFRELVADLTSGSPVGQPQDRAQRSYFGRQKRPDTFIDFQKSAAETTRLFRALDFGFHPNPFGYLKIRFGGDFLLIKDLSDLDATAESGTPGTIMALEASVLRISTAHGSLVIRALTTLANESVSIGELGQRYDLAEGQVLPPPDAGFRQHYHQADVKSVRHQAFWREQIRGFSPTALPLVSPRTVEKSRKPAVEFLEIDLSSVGIPAFDAVESLVEKTDRLLTAFLITVARFSNQPAVGVGYCSAVSARMAAETAGLLADCLPFTVGFDWESGFEKAVAEFRRKREILDENLTFARDWMAGQPALQPTAQVLREHGFPIVIQRSADENSPATYSKTLTLVVSDAGSCRLAYDSAVCDASPVKELVNRWLIVLENLENDPSQPLKTVSTLTPDERQRMLVDWNATAVPYPRDQTISELVEEQVRQRPQAIALRCGSVSLTYEQVNQRANQLARYLQRQGVKPDSLVGLCAERSPEMIIHLLAILKAGAAYVPLDPSYPAGRLAELSNQTNLQFILTTEEWLDRFPTEGRTCLLSDQEPAPWASENRDNTNTVSRADHLAYVLFTSGSTGQPKRVAIPHRGVVRLVKGANYIRLDESTVMLGLAPLAFDASTLEIWGCLANGGQLVLLTDTHPGLEEIKQTIQTHSVNTAFFTTALFNVLVDSGIEHLHSLTQLVTGGEAASAEHMRRARRQVPHCTLINGYGPTESTTFASFHTLSAADLAASSVPIGKPVSNTQLYLVDSFLNPVPVGIPGELLIGGDGLAREYLFQPELTSQKFIPDPYAPEPGRRLYRTGDLARYGSDGTLEFLGRLDDQVKIRGFRIEPGEIEHVLCLHPTVAEAVVVVAEPTPGNKALAAYLVSRPDVTIVPEELRAFLQTKLPRHLIPAAFVPLDALPLTANGKLDKKKLPPAFRQNHTPGGEARTPTETALLPLWTAVLNNQPSSCEDNFFEIGGSSILAMQLTARIHRHFNRLLTLKDLFDHPTVRQLSAFMDQNPALRQPLISATEPSSEPEMESVVPLSFAQNRLWIIHQLHALNGAYHVPIILKIAGPLNVPVLRQSLEEIVRRHPILRTTFRHTDGLPFQQIAPPGPVPVQVDQKTGSLAEWVQTEAYRPFDLETGPLLRIRVAHRGADSWVLLLVFHHIIYDGWSTRVLAKELSRAYTALVQHQSVALPALSLHYADYARWQLAHFTPQTLQRERHYWKNRLSGAPVLLNLPIDKPRPAIQSFEGTDYSFPVPDAFWHQIRWGLEEPGTTVFLRLLTVFSVWLNRVTRSHDLIVGIPVAGRNRPELAHTIGFFVNTLALRIEIRENCSFRQLLRQIRHWALEAYDHQELPFEQVVETLKLPRTLAYSPLVQGFFDFQEDTSKDWNLAGLQIESVPFEQHTAKFDLHLSFRETPAGAQGTFNYRSDLFANQTIERFARDFLTLLDELVAEPDKPIASLAGSFANRAEKPLVTKVVEPEAHDPFHREIAPSPGDSPLVDLLRSLWCSLLELPGVGLDEDFFNLGGHSLMAFQMTAELQRQTGHSIPVGSVFAHPTIRKLALHLKTTHADRIWASLVAVKPQGDRPPLFLIHPVSGEIGYVYQLAPYLPENRPVYGLRAAGLDGIATSLSSIEAMAAYYLQLIFEQQPEGPYLLGGYSMGGILAFEMARQLQKAGKEVSLVALIDSYPMNPNEANEIPLGPLVDYYYQYWRSLPKHPRQLWRFIHKKAPVAGRFFLNRLRHSWLHRSAKNGVSPGQSPLSGPHKELIEKNLRACRNYSFKPYDGKVVWLRAIGKDGLVDPRRVVSFGWDRYARQGVEVHALQSDHYSLFRDEAIIARIGAILSGYLTR